MPKYDYIVKDKGGHTIKGHEVTVSEKELQMKLARGNYIIISIQEASEKKGMEKALISFMAGAKKIKTFDLMVFCKQLGSMVSGGVPLVSAIDGIADDMKNRFFKEVLQEISISIRNGSSFSESLKKLKGVFSELFVANVEAAEKVGALDKMLERLSNYLIARDRINKKIISALAYPMMMATFFVIIIFLITVFLIPRFKVIYDDFGAALPMLTQILINISSFIVNNMVLIAIAVIVTIAALFHLVFRTKKGRFTFDGIILRLPLFGNVIMKSAISKFTRTLAILLEQGISVTESLNLVGRTSGNKVIEDASLKSSKLISNGETIPQAFKKMKIFPSLMIQMTSTGVESGSLPHLLDKTADIYEDQVDSFIGILMSVIEPIFIVSLGMVFALVVIALYLPIFKLGQLVTI